MQFDGARAVYAEAMAADGPPGAALTLLERYLYVLCQAKRYGVVWCGVHAHGLVPLV
jgi:hypothetical protein